MEIPGLLYIISGIVCLLSSILCVFLQETKHRDLEDMIHQQKQDIIIEKMHPEKSMPVNLNGSLKTVKY